MNVYSNSRRVRKRAAALPVERSHVSASQRAVTRNIILLKWDVRS
jgi:hypothetical protein